MVSDTPVRSERARRSVSPLSTLLEFGAGLLLLGGATLAGLVFVHRPWPNRLDVWGFRLLPANVDSRWAHDFTTLGSLPALIVGVIVIFLIAVFRDRLRACACAAAPIVAVLIVQDIAKPLVDRHNVITGGLSYPSGTVAAVTALVTALTLVMPPKTRAAVAALGLVAIVGTGCAVVVLRWHYPTDVLGGIGVGMGSVLLVDAFVHAVPLVASFLRAPDRDAGPVTEPPRVSRQAVHL
jgi:membrane-associated phospholipid phosphatase